MIQFLLGLGIPPFSPLSLFPFNLSPSPVPPLLQLGMTFSSSYKLNILLFLSVITALYRQVHNLVSYCQGIFNTLRVLLSFWSRDAFCDISSLTGVLASEVIYGNIHVYACSPMCAFVFVFCISVALYQREHTISVLVGLAYFSEHNDLQLGPFCCKW